MDPIYTLLSSLKGNQRQLDAVSNNLANVNTPGYKQDKVLFREMFTVMSGQDLESEQESFAHNEFISPLTRGTTSFVMPDHVSPQMSKGRMTPTENPYDFALQSEGFFSVQGPQGELYTRNGRFLKDVQGYLITNNGDRLLGEKGPIKVDDKNLAIGDDGAVVLDGQQVDKLKIVKFEQPSRLTKLGQGYWAPGSDKQKPIAMQAASVQQGMYEGSNVDTVSEMVNMISVNRSYEAAQRAMKANDELDEGSISLARV